MLVLRRRDTKPKKGVSYAKPLSFPSHTSLVPSKPSFPKEKIKASHTSFFKKKGYYQEDLLRIKDTTRVGFCMRVSFARDKGIKAAHRRDTKPCFTT